MPRKKLSRNAPSPCGSGKKYKHCCYGEVLEADLSLGVRSAAAAVKDGEWPFVQIGKGASGW
jgi:uncharacterized protein YecA (UPF0149 family)